MTTEEFKIKYPHLSHLEGDDLWNAMEQSLLDSDNVLIADTNREIIYHEPFKMDILQNDGVYREMTFQVEDDSTTKWLDKDGNEVKLPPQKRTEGKSYESYSFEIIDFGDGK